VHPTGEKRLPAVAIIEVFRPIEGNFVGLIAGGREMQNTIDLQ